MEGAHAPLLCGLQILPAEGELSWSGVQRYSERPHSPSIFSVVFLLSGLRPDPFPQGACQLATRQSSRHSWRWRADAAVESARLNFSFGLWVLSSSRPQPSSSTSAFELAGERVDDRDRSPLADHHRLRAEGGLDRRSKPPPCTGCRAGTTTPGAPWCVDQLHLDAAGQRATRANDAQRRRSPSAGLGRAPGGS